MHLKIYIMSLVGQGMHNTFVEAVDECLLCVRSRPNVERLILFKPEVPLRFIEAVGRRLIEAEVRTQN